MRRIISAIAALTVFFTTLVAAQPAAAVTAFTVTVVASGGAAENSTWSYANGQITPTATVSINAADIVAKLANGPLVIYSGRIVVSASIIHSTANSLTLKSEGNIIVGGGQTIQSQGGDVIFNSDSDANNAGHVRFGWDANCSMGYINTNGGDIVVGGGANPRTTVAATQNNDAASTGCPGGAPPIAGVAIYNFTLNAAGGDISVRGGSPNLGALSTRAVNIGGSGGLIPTFQTSGAGTILIYGDGSQITHNNAWGIATGSISVTTESGSITIEGRGNPAGPTNARGMSIGGASSLTSTTGNITVIDQTSGAGAGYTGINVGGAITATSQGNFTLQADEITQGGALNLSVNTAFIGSTNSSSFTATYLTGAINASGTQNLVIGSPGNTSAVTIGSTVTSGGPLSLNGGAVTINAALTATNSPIIVNASTSVSQNATITASALNLTGSASVNPSAFTVTGGVAQLAKLATFETQGGSVVAPVAFAIGGRLTLPAGPTKAGYEFIGWFAAPSGGSPLGANFVPSTSSDITIYAQWGVPGSNSMINSWMPVSASKGETVKLSFTGKYLDTVSKVSVSSGVATVVSQTPDKIEIEITGAEVGRGSIQLVGNSQTLTLGDIFTVTPAKQVQSIASLKLPKTLRIAKSVSFSRTLPSGLALKATVSGKCKLTATAITYRLTATASKSTCTVRLSNPGNDTYLPLNTSLAIKLAR